MVYEQERGYRVHAAVSIIMSINYTLKGIIDAFFIILYPIRYNI